MCLIKLLIKFVDGYAFVEYKLRFKREIVVLILESFDACRKYRIAQGTLQKIKLETSDK